MSLTSWTSRAASFAGRVAVSVVLAMILLAVEAACLWRKLLEQIRVRPLPAVPTPGPMPLRVLALGTFHNANWYRAHLVPLASSPAVGEVRMVSAEAGEPIRGVRWCIPPDWMRRLAGRNIARALVASWQALHWRPQVIVGYFIFPNALLALLWARLTGAAAVYQMGGGPLEIQRCGTCSENPFLRRVLPRFPGLHSLFMRVIGHFDLIVVRGGSARAFCREHFPSARIEILTAGIDCERFRPMSGVAKRFDVVTVARLSALKRMDILIQALARLSRQRPEITAAIVGDGPEREGLQRLCQSLGLDGHVRFTGTSDEVELILNQSRVFVLCSDSEGFSIAMAEAMACGLPAVVSDVGELAELVHNGPTGRRVPRGDVAAFATAIENLLSDTASLEKSAATVAQAAREFCSLPAVTRRWTRLLGELAGRSDAPAEMPRTGDASPEGIWRGGHV